MPDVLVLCPSERDRTAIRAAGLERRHRVRFAGEDLDTLADFDPEAFLAGLEDVPADAVWATKDQSALLAAVLAARRGLPGPSPAAVLACQHKPVSRARQAAVAPASTPRSVLLEGPPYAPPPELPPPFFVKPAVGRLSQGAVRVDGPEELERLPAGSAYADRYERIAALAGAEPGLAHGFLAEELLHGREVTLEGYVHRGRVTVIGVTDSVMYPGTNSFERFEYPSTLPGERLEELAGLARELVPAHGLDDAFFNIEFLVPEEGPPGIIELNARLASQFAPLVLAVHGRSTYDALTDLALGEDPAWTATEARGFAVSYVVRVFEDALVEAVPEPADDAEILVRPGLRLSEQGANDAQSYRLAIVYGAGATREEAIARCRERAAALSVRLAPSLRA